MKLVTSDDIPLLESRKIAKSLHIAAQKYAESGEVCSFQIIQTLQESLQNLNEDYGMKKKPESLWEEMQLRQLDESTSKRSDRFDFQFVDGDIFEDDLTTPKHSNLYRPIDTIPEDIPAPAKGDGGFMHTSSKVEDSDSDQASTLTEGRSFSSFINSVSSFRQNIPDMVRHLLDKTKSQSERTRAKDLDIERGAEESFAAIQRDLLIGRLLFDQKDSTSYPKDVLSAVELGLIPNWLGNLLLKHHAAFKVAFRRVFARQLASLEAKSSQNDIFDEPLHLIQYFSDFNKKLSPNRGQDLEVRERAQAVSHTSRYGSDFTEIKVLGRGGYGKVFLTLHKFDGRNYAVKRVNLHSSDGEFEKIMREVQTLSRMQHQHVVRYYAAWLETSVVADDDSSTDDGFLLEDSYSESSRTISDTLERDGSFVEDEEKQFLYIQMEYCQSTLRKMIDDGHIEDTELKWKVVRQLLSGLQYVHQEGVIHRDLKPANIFLDSFGDVKLGDFGLAKELAGHDVHENKLDHENASKRSKDHGTHGTFKLTCLLCHIQDIETQSMPAKGSNIYCLAIVFSVVFLHLQGLQVFVGPDSILPQKLSLQVNMMKRLTYFH